MRVVISGATQVLAHAAGLARHGSKPTRELPASADVERQFLAALRPFEQAVNYAPHQAYLGAIHPRDMPPRPWTSPRAPLSGNRSGGTSPPDPLSGNRRGGTTTGDPSGAVRFGPDGEIMPEEEFLGLLAAVDEAGLLKLDKDVAITIADVLSRHPVAGCLQLGKIEKAVGVPSEGSLLVFAGQTRAGAIAAAHDEDDSLAAHVLLENLSSKGTATLALLHLLQKYGIDPKSIDYVIGCGEEAIGDRYQRGGGNLAKAVAEVAGLTEASGADVKNFCAAPVPALVMAGALVAAGVFKRVAVVAGGSLAKLGMKFQGHLAKGLPVLEDVLGGAAALVEADDGKSPVIRLDAVGRHKVSAGGANPQIMQALAVEPLKQLGLPMTAVDDYATELHNPEVTETAGSGDVPVRNYRTIAALAAQKGDIAKDGINAFVAERGMPGFAPTQGHLASALCYLPWAVRRLTTGAADRALLLAKGSLFLGRMCQLSDGMSVILERNRA